MSDAIARLNTALEGRYEVEREIGEGGMATVFLAKDLKHNRNVALKVLKPELAAVVGAERFLAEIETTANLSHPHILPLYDSGEADSLLFYVMPYVEGESLRERLDREHQLPIDDAVRIATNMAEALDYAHRQGVIHRDIKPANVLLQDGKPVISDFGIALALGTAGQGRLTETGLSVGTPHYMSPEQATGDQTVGASTDIYALGAVLYEMLVGEPPYTGSTAQAVLGKIITGDAPSVREERKSVPLNVDAAIRKALEQVPADRFVGAQRFASALADPGFGHRGRSPTHAESGANRWKRIALATSLVSVALAMVAIWERTSVPWSRQGQTFHLSIDLGALDPLTTDDIVISPDGTAFAVSASFNGSIGLHYRRADESRFRFLPGTENGRYPAFSPDGRWIVYRDATPGLNDALRLPLMKVSVDGGEAATILPPGVVFNPLSPQWLDDGTIIFRGPGQGVFRIPDTGGEPELFISPDAGQFPRMLPGGRGLLRTRRGSVTLFDFAADSLRTIVSPGTDAMYIPTGHILYAHPDGGLYAVGFDLERLEVTGQPVLVLDDVRIHSFAGGAERRANYSVSKTGTLIIEADLPPILGQLAVVRPDGDNTELPLSPRPLRTPRWSPDGRSIAYSSGDHIFSYSPELATVPRQLTSEGFNSHPVWSPDGTRIAFSSSRPGTSQMDVFVKAATIEGREEQLFRATWSQRVTAWPEEDIVVFETRFNPPDRAWSNLWMSGTSAGSTPRPYVESEADQDQIVISPDGRWAAYRSDEDGTEEVFVRSFPEPGQQVRVSTGGGHYPRWSPDGGTLYYWRGQDQPVDTLLAASVLTDPTFSVASQEPVLAGDYLPELWDLHPDGNSMLVAAPVTDIPGRRFQVILNFFEELRQRVPLN
ncbi:MAG: serine/threonine-protein kinase [Gemmatimonadota bacterium]|nr:serine/threonine-protein kinase [Gemmatimonadota bacterium]